MPTNQQKNEDAFRASMSQLQDRFPVGHFVAFDGGELVADAATFDELTDVLVAIGKDRPDVFVAQSGIDYPNEVFILFSSRTCLGRD